MAQYMVKEDLGEYGQFHGWSVFLGATRVAGPFETEAEAKNVAASLELLAQARLEMQQRAESIGKDVLPYRESDAHFSGNVLDMNEHYILIDGGRHVHIVNKAPLIRAGIPLEVGKVSRFSIRDGITTNTAKPKTLSRSSGLTL